MYFYCTEENLKTKRNTKLASHCPEITIVNIFCTSVFSSLPPQFMLAFQAAFLGQRKKPQGSLKCLPERLHLLGKGAEIQAIVFVTPNPFSPESMFSLLRCRMSPGKSLQEKFKVNSLYYIIESGTHGKKTQQGLQFF